MSDDKSLIISENGTVVEYEQGTDIIRPSALSRSLLPLEENSPLPIHEQYLQAIESLEIQEAAANAFYGSEPLSFKLFAGKEKTVLGMILFQHGPYLGKDGKEHPEGYYQVLILLEDKDEEGRYKLVKSGSLRLAMHICTVLRARGWFLFEEPRRYVFALGSNGAHFLFDRGCVQLERGIDRGNVD